MNARWIATAIAVTISLGAIAAITHQRSLGPNTVVLELFTSQG